MNRVINGNILSFCRHYKGDPFHAIFCDPPYHLTSIVKRFSTAEPEHTKTAHDIANRSTPHARQAAGFMGQHWDGGDVAFKPETWKALANLLYPGAFIFAFAGTRGYHRMAVAMEDSGLIIHPAIGWVFGSGFPKATRIDTQLENGSGDQWAGHRYGLQALKPAFEFIAVAQKPYKGRSVDCITRTGSGALNIEGGRIGVDSIPSNQWTDNAHPFGNGAGNDYETVINQGRWPANFLLSHSPDCGSECVEGCAIKMMDEQSGELASGSLTGQPRTENKIYGSAGSTIGNPRFHDGDSGTASRFFFNADYMLDRFEDSDPIMYQAKAGRSERDAGLVDFDEKEVPYAEYRDNMRETKSIVSLYPDGSPRPINKLRNNHPTIKPISLCKYLATLLLPPDSYAPRRLLIPFSGAGSEMIGSLLSGWDHIIGVEMTKEYAEIAKARLAWWESKLADGHTNIDRMLATWNKESELSQSEDEQLSLL